MIKKVNCLLTVIILILSAYSSAIFADAHSVALVHIGDKLPSYLDDTLAQIRAFNKECPLYLLVSEKVFPLLHSRKTSMRFRLLH